MALTDATGDQEIAVLLVGFENVIAQPVFEELVFHDFRCGS
jgi:hypothetical protein